MSQCPNCGCPFMTRSGSATADIPRAWQDEDGMWYKGHAGESETLRCDGCGWTVVRVWEFGKLVREDMTNHGRPTGEDGA